MKTVLIERFEIKDNYSLGKCYIIDEDNCKSFIGMSIERGWQDNKRNISCVPEGEYPLELEYSPRFNKDLWELKKVPNRSECKFHAANYWNQLNGCIALGRDHKDINSDGDPDVTHSRDTMKLFHRMLSDDVKARIIIKNI